MSKKNIIWIVVGGLVIAGLVAALVVSLQRVKRAEHDVASMVEQFNYEKEALEDEYVSVSEELQGFAVQIDNDSILKKLDEEQKRVQLLLEELRTTKATNSRRIAELKKELSTVRKVLTYYIAQVDSLNRINSQLLTENQEVRQQYQDASRTVETLSKEKHTLTERVNIASQLEARNIMIEAQNARGKSINRVNRASLLKISFTIGKNITAPVGEKNIYVRIVTPDDQILSKNSSDTFQFENRQIAFSCKKRFEYTGEELSEVVYWAIEETLWAGDYRVDIFVDGHLIGSQAFILK